MGYSISRTVTIDHTKVPSTDQSNFPVAFAGTYAWLATVANGGSVTSSSGFDIIFTSDSAGASILDFEIESYDATNGAVVFWIRIPTVSHTTDTVFYIFYGNSAITTSQANPAGVWDSNYIGVWHGNITHPSNYQNADSTGNGHTAVSAINPTSSSGVLDGAADVGAGGGTASMLMDKFPTLFDGSNQIWTIEGWFQNFNPTNGNNSTALGTQSPSVNACVRFIFGSDGSTNNFVQLIYMPANWFTATFHVVGSSSNTISSGVYYHVVVVLDLSNSANGKIFFNGGSNSGSQTTTGSPATTLNTLGNNMWQGLGPDNKNFSGRIDELRFSKSARSGDWATTSYNSQSSPSTFYALGSPVAGDMIGSVTVPSIASVITGGSLIAQIEGTVTVPSIASVFAGGSLEIPIIGLTTVPSLSSVITGGTLTGSLAGIATVPSLRAVFAGGAILSSATGIKVFVDSVDRSAYFSTPISGSLSVGSTGNATLPLSNVGTHGTFLSTWTPVKWDEIQIYIDTYRVFGGYVDTVQQTLYRDADGQKIYSCNAWSYGVILDRIFVAAHFELYDGALANIIMANLVSRYLVDRGYSWGGSGGDTGPLFPPFSINWWSFSQVNQYVCSKANWSSYVDQFKVLRMFGIASISRPAPFTLTKSNSKYETMKPTRGGEYYNYIIVRNSQNLGSNWSDDFAGDVNSGSGFYAPLTAALTSKPAVYVNGVAKVVTDPGVYGSPWDFYWLAFGVVRNPALAALTGGDTVTVTYPLDIDYVVIRKDDTEIALYGKVMKIVEIKDITTLQDMGLIADGELAKGIEDITTLEAQCDLPGIEPGTIVHVTADAYDQNFMVESVDFNQIAPDLFRFTIKGSDANVQRRNSGPALFQRLLNQATQARDRVQTPVGFALWVTVGDPASNPGGTVGIIPGAIRTMPVGGVCVKCTLNFQSVATTLTTSDVIIDVLMDGVSIFPAGDPAKMIYPAGATQPQTVILFLNDPQEVTNVQVVTLNCIQTDPNAFDGVLELTVQG